MEKTYIKNLSFICLFMILIHLAGLTYQFITRATTLAICLKILYILMFAFLLFTLLKRKKFSYLVGIISSCIIIIISAIYMDFLSIIIALLVIFYSYNLKNYNLKSYSKNKISNDKNSNKKVHKKRNK